MRHTMGRFIDELSPEDRDLLITATEFNDGKNWWDHEGCGCLVGTVYRGGWHKVPEVIWERVGTSSYPILATPWHRATEAIRYPKAVERFGKARIVRAIKLRAARGNKVTLNTPSERSVSHV